jgi:hypothetical protein
MENIIETFENIFKGLVNKDEPVKANHNNHENNKTNNSIYYLIKKQPL